MGKGKENMVDDNQFKKTGGFIKPAYGLERPKSAKSNV
jgi:hypothetical protein